MIIVESKILINELETDGHSPMKFVCSDGSVYFTKYKSGISFDKKEINCLVFEMVCTRLLNELDLPVPDDALVVISPDSYTTSQLRANKRYLRDGVICWGSKEIERSDLVKAIEQIQKLKEFNRYLNPSDLIRIAIFDLWIDNIDRHSENYNLLVKLEDNKLKIIAIDHAFAFGGVKAMNIFNENSLPNTYRKLILSPFFKSIVKFIPKKERLVIINEFLSLINNLDIASIINEVFAEIPTSWGIDPNLEKRLADFLHSNNRIATIEQITKLELSKNFK